MISCSVLCHGLQVTMLINCFVIIVVTRLAGLRLHWNCTLVFLKSLQMPSRKYQYISLSHGGIGLELTMGVVWSLISYAGCMYKVLSAHRGVILIFLFTLRLCLERLGVIKPADHKALVIRVFWRCVNFPSLDLKVEGETPGASLYRVISDVSPILHLTHTFYTHECRTSAQTPI